MGSSDEIFFDLDGAAAITGLTRKRIRELIRAGAPFTGASRPPRRRHDETDLRHLLVIAEICSEFDLPAPDAVAFWANLTPDGKWPTGSKHILFSLDGEPVARIYPGAIAARLSRRILAADEQDEALRLAAAGLPSTSNPEAGATMSGPRRQTQRFVEISARQFHPARLARASTKESSQ